MTVDAVARHTARARLADHLRAVACPPERDANLAAVAALSRVMVSGVNPLNRRNVQLSGPDKIRLVTALSRAHVRPFDKSDWACYCDAMGDAAMVRMHEHDWVYFRKALQMEWHPEQPDLILDEGGLSWNLMCERGYAYQVVVDLNVSCWDAEKWGPGEE